MAYFMSLYYASRLVYLYLFLLLQLILASHFIVYFRFSGFSSVFCYNIYFSSLKFRASDPKACEVDAVVVGIREKCIIAYASDLGVRCRIFLDSLPATVFKPSATDSSLRACTIQRGADKTTISADGDSVTIALFDHVRVRMGTEATPYRRPELTMALVSLQASQQPGKFALPRKAAAPPAPVDEASPASAPATTMSIYEMLDKMCEMALLDEDPVVVV
jgi:hypothetical protein